MHDDVRGPHAARRAPMHALHALHAFWRAKGAGACCEKKKTLALEVTSSVTTRISILYSGEISSRVRAFFFSSERGQPPWPARSVQSVQSVQGVTAGGATVGYGRASALLGCWAVRLLGRHGRGAGERRAMPPCRALRLLGCWAVRRGGMDAGERRAMPPC